MPVPSANITKAAWVNTSPLRTKGRSRTYCPPDGSTLSECQWAAERERNRYGPLFHGSPVPLKKPKFLNQTSRPQDWCLSPNARVTLFDFISFRIISISFSFGNSGKQ